MSSPPHPNRSPFPEVPDPLLAETSFLPRVRRELDLLLCCSRRGGRREFEVESLSGRSLVWDAEDAEALEIGRALRKEGMVNRRRSFSCCRDNVLGMIYESRSGEGLGMRRQNGERKKAWKLKILSFEVGAEIEFWILKRSAPILTWDSSSP